MTEDIDTEPDDVLAGVRQLWSGYFDGTEALRLIKGILERSWPEEVLRRARECISDCRDAEEDPPDAVSWLRGELLRLEREGDELAAAIPF